MPLNRLRVHRDHLGEGVERDVPDVVVLVAEEPSEDVHRQHPKAAHGFRPDDRVDGFVEDGVPRVLGAVGVGRDVGEDVRHGVAGVRVPRAELGEQPEQLHLQKRIRVSAHVVLRRVPGSDQGHQNLHQHRDVLSKVRHVRLVQDAQLQRQGHRAE